MHSFQPSRGRILFEVLCALAVVSSMVGAWRQTHASALLVAAAAAGLWAMARLMDLGRRHPVAAEEPQRIAFEPGAEGGMELRLPADTGDALLEQQPDAEVDTDEAERVEKAPRSGSGRRKGGSRKSSGRRATPKAAEVIEFVPVPGTETEPAPEVAQPEHSDNLEVAGPSSAEEPYVDFPDADDEPVHVQHAPLFEPEPFVRMQRQAFGRRGRI